MKFLYFVVLSCLAGVAWGATKYSDKFDNINVDEILESRRLLRGYVDCFMDKGRCTSDGKSLKEILPDAIERDCDKCTPKQKSNSDKVVRHLVNKRPDLWDELATKYDPKNIYQQKYKDKIDALKE